MKTLVATTFLGLPLVAWGGVTVLTLLGVQILIGLRLIKVDFKYHTYLAWILLSVALIHATAALIYIFG
jgi:cytochrome b561